MQYRNQAILIALDSETNFKGFKSEVLSGITNMFVMNFSKFWEQYKYYVQS